MFVQARGEGVGLAAWPVGRAGGRVYIIPYSIISYRIVSYHCISYRIMSYQFISYSIISCHIIKFTVHVSYMSI